MHYIVCHFNLKGLGESYPVEFSVGGKMHFFEITQDLMDNVLSYCQRS